MKVVLTEDLDSNINDEAYTKGQMIDVVELRYFNTSYARYYFKDVDFPDGKFSVQTMDWIPKEICEVIKDNKI